MLNEEKKNQEKKTASDSTQRFEHLEGQTGDYHERSHYFCIPHRKKSLLPQRHQQQREKNKTKQNKTLTDTDMHAEAHNTHLPKETPTCRHAQTHRQNNNPLPLKNHKQTNNNNNNTNKQKANKTKSGLQTAHTSAHLFSVISFCPAISTDVAN
jgi:hypothetical protein